MKKQSDALSTAWETIKTPVVAAHTAVQDQQEQDRKEQEMLARAVRRNVRERQARHLAKGVSFKAAHAKEGTVLHSGGHSESSSSVISAQEKKALHRNISHLMDKLPKEGPVKGIKITKKTVSVKPVAKITKVKKPVTVCDLSKKGKDADMNNLTHNQKVKFAALITRKYVEKQADDDPMGGIAKSILKTRETMPEYKPHGSSFIPGVGGFVSGGVKPNPGETATKGSFREGGAGLGGGLKGGLVGGGLAALLQLLLKGKWRGGAALGGLGGGALGTRSAVGDSKLNTPITMEDFALQSQKIMNERSKKAGALNLTSTQRVKVAALIIHKYQQQEKTAIWGMAAKGALAAGKAGLGALGRGAARGAGGLSRAAGKGLSLGGKALERGVTTGGNIASRGAAGAPGAARQAIGRGMQTGGAAMQRLPGAAQTMANRGMQAGQAAMQRLPAQTAAGIQGLGRAGTRGIQAGTNMAGRMAASPQAAAASKALRALPGQARGLANRGIQAGTGFASRNRTPLGLGAAGLGGYGMAGGFNSQEPSWSPGSQDLDIPNNWAQQLGSFGNMAGTGQGMPPGVIRNMSRSDF